MTSSNQIEQPNRSGRQKHSDESEQTSGPEHVPQRETCPECAAQIEYDSKHGERACTECGLVVTKEEIDHGPEWTEFDNGDREQKSRTGKPITPTMHDKGLSTEIDWRNKDAHGNSLSNRQRRKMSRLRTWHSRSQTEGHQDRNLRHGLGEIARMTSALGLPKSIQETASVIHRRAVEDDLLTGRSIEGVASAALYVAIRQSNSVRSLNKVVTVSRVDKKKIGRTYRHLNRELNLEIEPPDPTDHLPHFCSELELSAETEHLSRELLEPAVGTSVTSGKNPLGLAAAAVYASAMLTNEKVTQRAVSEIADISQVTIRNRYKELLELRESTRNP